MAPDTDTTHATGPDNLQKYRLAGYGFLVLNSVYVILAWNFMPPFLPGFPKHLFWPFILLLILFLTRTILNRRSLWVKSLAVLFALRILTSTGLILKGDYLPVVPYLIPCFILTFYLLGRAAWNWP